MDAFDADALIYAAVPGHPLGRRVLALFRASAGKHAGIGSVLLLPEVLAKPVRDGDATEVSALASLLARLDLRPVDRAIAELATVMAAKYRMRAADAIHLATGIAMGATRFITNNSGDFTNAITEIDVTYPDDLPVGSLLRRIGLAVAWFTASIAARCRKWSPFHDRLESAFVVFVARGAAACPSGVVRCQCDE